MNSSDKWDFRFLDLAFLISQWSKDPSTKVGAVIVDSRRRIVGTGFNGFPRNTTDDEINRDRKLLRTIHAEANALHFAVRDVEGCTIYVTHPPCAHCSGHLIQRGICRVVFNMPSNDFFERWRDNYNEAMLMFSEAGVSVEIVS